MNASEMPARVVIDASVGIKWVLHEEQTEDAIALVRDRELLTSALFWAEAGNAIAGRVRRGHLDRQRADDAWRELRAVPMQTRGLDADAIRVALDLAHDLAHPIYDCCYLAVAVAEQAVVVTADGRFRSAVAKHPSLADWVLLLRDIVLDA